MTNGMWKFRRAVKLFCFCLPVLMAACGSPPPRQPVAVEQAQQVEHAAHRALRDGDLVLARELFTQSLWLQQSLDNLSGAAMAVINIATVHHRMGDDSAALRQLDRILEDGAPAYPPELRAAAAFRKAVILVDAGDAGQTAAVESTLQLADTECFKPCAYTPGISNLRARLALQKGDYVVALKLAKATLDASRAEKEELANARRISASAEMALGHHDMALTHYLAALDMDKELGISARIVMDLNGIAKAMAQLGRKQEADAYARRAAAVMEAARFLPDGAMKKPML